MEGRCRCEEICRKAVRDYSRDYDRKRGVKPSTQKSWTEEELELMRTSTLTNRELMDLLPGRTYEAITRKRSRIGSGLFQRGLPAPHTGMRGKPTWNKGKVTRTSEETQSSRPVRTRSVRVRVPLPEIVRNNRVRKISNGKVYRICGVHMDSDQPYVWLDRVDTMFSRLLKTPLDRLSEKYEGIASPSAE